MTSANDEFMILMVGLSTHFSDEMMTLTKFGMHCKKGNLGDRILMQLSFRAIECRRRAAELSWTNNAGTNVQDAKHERLGGAL